MSIWWQVAGLAPAPESPVWLQQGLGFRFKFAYILQVAGLAPAPESPVWLRWRGRGAAAELAEQRLMGPHWREVGDPGAPADAALLEDGGQVHPPAATLVLFLGLGLGTGCHPTPAHPPTARCWRAGRCTRLQQLWCPS